MTAPAKQEYVIDPCKCGQVVMLRHSDGSLLESCACTVARYEALHGPLTDYTVERSPSSEITQ